MMGGGPQTPVVAKDILSDVPEWSEAERLANEKESLGFFITGHPLERFREELAQWATVTIAGLSGLTEPREVSVGGLTGGLRLLKTKKGDRMATFVLEDLDGSVDVLVFPETYKKVAARLADDQVVVVKGKAEIVDDGKPRLLATDVTSLDQAKLQEARQVTIRIDLAAWDRSKGERLRDILGARQGDCPVVIELARPGEFAVSVAPSALYRVRPDATLKDEVEALFGAAGSVHYSRTNGGR
jgi:DNA polymerase-3 subunit alpha